MKMISADDFYRSYCDRYECYVSDDELSRIALAVASAPTIDLESPRPQGTWEDEYGGKYANPRYRCSVCKEKALYKMKLDHLGGWHEVQALTPSCPNCGAKMKIFEVGE